MSMQEFNATARGKEPYAPRRKWATTGNFHRAHDYLVNRMDKNGVVHTTAVAKELTARGMTRSSAASSIFQWTDPTGVVGQRKVRLYSPRVAASDPNEPDTTPTKGGETASRPVTTAPIASRTWTTAFGELPKTNKDGPFYNEPRSGGPKGFRRVELAEQLLEYQKTSADKEGFFVLRSAVEHLAELGFNAHTVYHSVRWMVENGGVKKRGARRYINPMYVRQLKAHYDLEPFVLPQDEGAPGGVEQINTEQVNDPAPSIKATEDGARSELDRLVRSTLATPDMQKSIDDLVSEAIIASTKRQLGLS